MASRLMFTTLLVLVLGAAACGSEDDDPRDEGHGEERHDTGEEEDGIALEAAERAGIEIAQAGPARIREVLSLYGTVQPNAERVRDVTARYPGIVRSVAKVVGDTARQGDVLATVESNESLQTYTIVAPLGGVITARRTNPGEYTGESALFTVADLSSVWVELALFPRDLSKVRVAQVVRIKNVEGDVSADGKIIYLAPVSQATSQTLTARVALDNSEGIWSPGLYVTGEVTLSESVAAVAVKSTAIQTIDERSVVFALSDDRLLPQAVELGRSDGEYSEIRNGLTATDRYASSNTFVLKSELSKGEAEHEH